MLPARRFLPSLSLLTAFEAAARTGSITAAARELDLTQSAVSRQIKALESQLGVELFLRERQTIRLTVAGDSYAREIREALRRGLARITRFAGIRSGADPDAVQRFIAYGQLCHLVVTAGLEEIPEEWAHTLTNGIRHP